MSVLRKWLNLFLGKTEKERLKQFRMVSIMEIMGAGVITAVFFNEWGRGSVITILSVAAIVGLILLYAASFYVKKSDILYWVFFTIVCVIFFPYYFAINHGIEKSDQIWALTCLILTFIFLDGWKLRILWGMAAIAYAVSYGTFIPEFGVSFVLLSYGSMMVFGTMFGLIIRRQVDGILREQKTAEERGREIEAQSNSKTLYFANMSHEIRTPINTIIGLNEMNLKEKLPDDILENSTAIQSAGNTLLALVNDILDWSKLESGKMEIVPVEYELAAMLKELINVNFAPANEKGLDFMIDIDETIPSVLFGDEVHIRQIVNNILANAVKYTSKGSVSLIVSHEKINEKEVRLKISVEEIPASESKKMTWRICLRYLSARTGKRAAWRVRGWGFAFRNSLSG